MSSIVTEVIGVSGVSNVGDDKSMMFKKYHVLLSIHPLLYELSLGICFSGDLSVVPSLRE